MRKICVYTSSRAEYGLLRRLLYEIEAYQTLELQILVSGMHLSPEFGMTIKEIEDDGFKLNETVEILLSSDNPTAICKSMGLALIGYGETLQRLRPDMVVVVGDRFETFCMAAAAHVSRIPIAHIHGGETTEGAIDDAFRHSITKMSHLHFASCEAYRQRIIQLGEEPGRVFNVGALGVENIQHISFMQRSELANSIGFNLEKPYFLVTFHPVTLEKDSSERQFKALLAAMDAFPNYNILFTKANADTDGRVINRLIDEYVESRSDYCFAVTSLGMLRYLSAMKYSTAVIGNSSSGIIESPCFKVPTVNIGNRQKGRLQTSNILNCMPDSNAIRETIACAVSPSFQDSLLEISNPYDRPGTSATIVRLLETTKISGIIKKTFHDIRLS